MEHLDPLHRPFVYLIAGAVPQGKRSSPPPSLSNFSVKPYASPGSEAHAPCILDALIHTPLDRAFPDLRMPFFSRFRNKDGLGATSKSKSQAHLNGGAPPPPPKPRWGDAWLRKEVEPEEVQELLRACTNELKAKALDMPFLLLPFRPTSDPSAARTFIRNFFNEEREPLQGERLEQELMLTEPMVLSGIMKWCWSRLAGGVVTWEAYELFRVGEQDSDMARDAFATFIPISVESDARTKIIFDFFDLMAAITAHGKSNGMGGQKLSRLAGWWAFEQIDNGNGFDGGYKSWARAADATCHLFFAYLRSLSPESVRGVNGISALPRSLQTLAEATEYPPEQTSLNAVSKVVMIVDRVSPTPFALLRRAKHFEYRDDDEALQEFSDYEDPVQALTEECRRVLKCISSTNQSAAATSKTSTSLRNPDAEWSRFEDLGFGSFANESEDELKTSALGRSRRAQQGPTSAPRSKTNDMGRPTTPSWADFLSSGFVDDSSSNNPAPLLLPPDKILPPIDANRINSSGSQQADNEGNLEPGELASINTIYFDDVFWWVWITSLAGEEPPDRKAVFGRCALLETDIRGGKWLVLEEMVKGAAPEPEMGYIAEKKSRNPFSKRSRLGRTKTTKKLPPPPKVESYARSTQQSPLNKSSITNDQHARIQAAAAALQRKQKDNTVSPRRARAENGTTGKTNSIFTLQPVIMSEAAPAMKWATTYDKNADRAKYLGDNFGGKGSSSDLASAAKGTNGSITPVGKREQLPKSESYGFPSKANDDKDRALPALPPQSPTIAAPQNPPPPPPTMPAVTPSTQSVTQAAEVPLPATTPGESHAIERKPLPSTQQAAQVPLPATTPMETEKPLPPAGIAGPDEPTVNDLDLSPDSKKKGKKLTKKETGGIRGLFGRKKSGPASPAPPQPADSAAVAAARAALSGTTPKANYVAPDAPSSLSRRFSRIGRKSSPVVTPKASPSVAAIHDEERPPSPPVYQPQPRMADRYDPQHRVADTYEPPNRFDSQTSISRASSEVQRDADQEFNRFDQGPVEQPAFVPVDSPERSERPSTDMTTPVEQHVSSRVSSVSEGDQPPSPAQDRWAQIRRNAAERVAARQSEDQPSSMGASRTDDGDGETSGEESKFQMT
ncbi:MAG: hypothetical protein Q9219_004180 [cf. Caloplaca sp. 3 TL-2023]